MIQRDQIIEFISSIIGVELISKAQTKDQMANGVQFWVENRSKK